MVHTLRRLLLVLIAFAFIGGTSSQFARTAASDLPSAMASMPCAMMMSQPGMQGDKPMPPGTGSPCKAPCADCKQMGCVADATLPARTVNLDIAIAFSDVDYWSAWSSLADFVREPEPLPPRTI